MFDLEKRHTERQEELAQQRAEEKRIADENNQRARDIASKILHYVAKFSPHHFQPDISTTYDNTVVVVNSNDQSDRLEITAESNDKYRWQGEGPAFRNKHASGTHDERDMMDITLDWLYFER
jgi:hypothetical protein